MLFYFVFVWFCYDFVWDLFEWFRAFQGVVFQSVFCYGVGYDIHIMYILAIQLWNHFNPFWNHFESFWNHFESLDSCKNVEKWCQLHIAHNMWRHCRGLDQPSKRGQTSARPEWSQPGGGWDCKSKTIHAAQCSPPVPLHALGLFFWGGCQPGKESGQWKKNWRRGSPSHHLIQAKYTQRGKPTAVPDCCSDIYRHRYIVFFLWFFDVFMMILCFCLLNTF